MTRSLSPIDRAALDYFLQLNGGRGISQRGTSEAFADIYAMLRGGSSSEQFNGLLRRAFPEIAKLLRRVLTSCPCSRTLWALTH